MQRILRSAFPALVAAIAGLSLLASDSIAKTLTRGSPAEWKLACDANPRSCFMSQRDSSRVVYKICMRGQCYAISCGTASINDYCERTSDPGARPRPKQLQWSMAELL